MNVSKTQLEGTLPGQVPETPERQSTKLKSLWMSEGLLLAFIMLLLALVYGLLPIYLDGPLMLSHPDTLGGFWSPDSGARFAMIRNWIHHGSLVHLYYPYSNIDPTGQIHPLSYFLFHRKDDFVAMYPTLFPFVSGLSYRAFGFYGLTIVPMVCGLGCILTTYVTAKRLGLRCRLLLILAMGLATPLVIYSTVFWDHSALMLVAALTGHWMLRSVRDNNFHSAFITGIMIGLGMWLHEQFLALFVAVWIAAIPLSRSYNRIILGVPAGFLCVIIAWSLFNYHVYGVFAGPHLGANVLQNGSDHPFNLETVLDVDGFMNRAMAQLVGTTLPGSSFAAPSQLWPYYLSLACSLIVLSGWGWEANRIWENGGLIALGLVAASLALFLVIKISAIATPAGLFQATPLLIPALAVPWYSRRKDKTAAPSGLYQEKTATGVYYAWLSRTCFLFLLFLLINPMYPGTDWGSRYLLTALPMLVILVAHTLERQHEKPHRKWHISTTVYAMLLVVASLYCQGLGLFWIHRMLAYDQALNAHLKPISSALLVTDSDFNARLLPKPERQARVLVRTNDDVLLFINLLRREKIQGFYFLGLKGNQTIISDAISSSGGHFRVADQYQLFKVNPKHEIGDEFQVTHYVLETEKYKLSTHPAIGLSLVCCYRFGSSSGKSEYSSSTSKVINNVTLVGGATISTPNFTIPFRNGLCTNGSSEQAAKLPISTFRFMHSDFTVEQWFTRADETDNYQTLFSLSTDLSHYLIAHSARGDNHELSVDFCNGSSRMSLYTPAPLPATLTLLTLTYSAALRHAILYINGNPVDAQSMPARFDLASIATEASGINGLSPFGDPSLNGSTSEFSLYQGALTPAQIKKQFQLGLTKLAPL